MKIRVGENVYEHDPNSFMNSEAIQVKKLTRMTIPQFQTGLEDDDPEAVKALVFLLKRRAGEAVEWDTLDFDHAEIEYNASDEPEPGDAGPKEAGPGNPPG